MINQFWASVGFVAYLFLFTGIVFSIGFWRRSKRGDRDPLEFRLLRSPGEGLRRRMQTFDDNLFFYVSGAALVPPILTYLTLLLIAKLAPRTEPYLGLAITALVFGIVAYLCGRWLWGKFVENRNCALGYLGERTVAEALTPLWREGYRIFHDLPAEAGDRKFNIDHVVVGPTGVFAIETKTRRKGRARPGFKDHEVTFDGQQLVWPWGEDRHGLEQAESEARWLSEWLHRMTGLEVAAKPILALPGWYVKATARGIVNVVNAKALPSAVKGRGQRVLSDEQIDLIARQLEDCCRDVED
jgi:hypothetical protein